MSNDNRWADYPDWVGDARARRAISDSPPLGACLGRIDAWGIFVFEGSPQVLIDTLMAEAERDQ